MHAAPEAPVRRRPPVAVLLAVPLAVLSSLALAFFELIALAFSDGQFDDGGWAVVTVPAVLALWLLVGAVLLLRGRSWLAVFLPAAALTGVLVWLIMTEDLVDDAGGTAVLVWALPTLTALLSVLPAVRRWIAARKLERLDR
jgi:integrase